MRLIVPRLRPSKKSIRMENCQLFVNNFGWLALEQA